MGIGTLISLLGFGVIFFALVFAIGWIGVVFVGEIAGCEDSEDSEDESSGKESE